MKLGIGSNGRYIYVVDVNNNFFVIGGSVVGVIDDIFIVYIYNNDMHDGINSYCY
jgi:hypothetical protein